MVCTGGVAVNYRVGSGVGVIVLGRPSGGKGTLVERMSRVIGAPYYVVSDLVKAERLSNPEFAAIAQAKMDKGILLGDDEINSLVQKVIENLPGFSDMFLDGSCRTPGQFRFTRDCLLRYNILPIVVELELSRKSANERRLTRIQEALDKGEQPRPDDLDEEIFNDRQDTYEREHPLVHAEVERLHPSFRFKVDAEVGPEEVFRATMELLHFDYLLTSR